MMWIDGKGNIVSIEMIDGANGAHWDVYEWESDAIASFAIYDDGDIIECADLREVIADAMNYINCQGGYDWTDEAADGESFDEFMNKRSVCLRIDGWRFFGVGCSADDVMDYINE